MYMPFQNISGDVYVCYGYRLCLCYNNFLIGIWNCSEDIYIVLSFYFTLSCRVSKEGVTSEDIYTLANNK